MTSRVCCSMDTGEEEHKLLEDEAMRPQVFSTVDFHMPSGLIGTGLKGVAKLQYTNVKKKIDKYNAESVATANIIYILDDIESIKSAGNDRAIPVLSEMVSYLRTLLLSSDTELVLHTVILLDGIIKNSGYLLHAVIGRRKFMKTLSLVARRHLSESSYDHHRVGIITADCLQAWGEAFSVRQEQYPHIYNTYQKLRSKYGVKFLRPDFDPTRVPIFLGPVSAAERQIAARFNSAAAFQYGSTPTASSDTPEDIAVVAITHSLADIPVPQDQIDYHQVQKFNAGISRMRHASIENNEELPDPPHPEESHSLIDFDVDWTEPSTALFLANTQHQISSESRTCSELVVGVGDGECERECATFSPEERILSLYNSSTMTSPQQTAFEHSQWFSPPLHSSTKVGGRSAPVPTETFAPVEVDDSSDWALQSAPVTPAVAWVQPSNLFDISPPPSKNSGGVIRLPDTSAIKWDLQGTWDLSKAWGSISERGDTPIRQPTPMHSLQQDSNAPTKPEKTLKPERMLRSSSDATLAAPAESQQSEKSQPPRLFPTLVPATVREDPHLTAPPLSPPLLPRVMLQEPRKVDLPPPLPSFPPPTQPPTQPPPPPPAPALASASALAENTTLLFEPTPHLVNNTKHQNRKQDGMPSLEDTLQRTKANLTRIESHPRSKPTAPGTEDAIDQITTEKEKIDTSAGARLMPPQPKPLSKKKGFIAPSSDPHAQIVYYGTQRVVIRKTT